MPPRSSRRGRETPPGRPAVPSSATACGWAGLGLVESPQPEPPGPSSSGTARGPAAGFGRGCRNGVPGPPSCPAALGDVLDGVPRATGWHPQMANSSEMTWRRRRSGFLPGFRHHCSKVRTKEGSGQGWLVETRVVLLSDKLKQVRTLRVLCTSTLSVASAITLCVRSGCLSHHRPCARVSTPSLNELPFHGGFYPVSTPITAIRHRCSSFCTWPTYLPLSPESFSRCRLRWTTPPSPQLTSCNTELAICPQTKVTVYDKLFADQAMHVDFGLHSHCSIKFKTLITVWAPLGHKMQFSCFWILPLCLCLTSLLSPLSALPRDWSIAQ